MPTLSINNFLVDSPNTNDFGSVLSLFSAQYKTEGIIEGFYVKATGANNSVQIMYSSTETTVTNTIVPNDTDKQILGFATVSLGNKMRPVWEQGTSARNITFLPNPVAGILFSLVCIRINDNTNTNDIVFEQGTSGQDPNLASLETGNIKYLPIARVRQPASNGVITQAEIDFTGNCNTGDFRPIGAKAVPRSNKGVRTLTQAEENMTTFVESDTWYNSTTGDYRAYQNNTIVNLKVTRPMWSLNSPLSLGTYSAINLTTTGSGLDTKFNRVARTSPATVFDDIFSGATGTGSFAIPANSLKVGDIITVRGAISSTYSNATSTGGATTGFLLNILANGATINSFAQRAYNSGNYEDVGMINVVDITTSGAVPVTFPYTLSHEFILQGTVLTTGTTGKIRFREQGSKYGFSNITMSGKPSTNTICTEATIDTTITQTLTFNFDVYRRGNSANNAATLTLNSFSISKN